LKKIFLDEVLCVKKRLFKGKLLPYEIILKLIKKKEVAERRAPS
jgi:hypothetical protein